MKRSTKLILAFALPLLLLTLWSLFIEPGELKVTRLEIAAHGANPMKIGFIADLHAGSPHIDLAYVKNVVAKLNDEKPDLVLIGGDLVINGVVGGSYIPIDDVAPLFKSIKAPMFAVLGNHDWWNEGPHIRDVLEKNGITVLENAATTFKGYSLVGIGDDTTRHANVKAALAGAKEPRLVFMHDPGALLDTHEKFFLTLAGHMHGGQIALPFIGPIITPGRAPAFWAKKFLETENGPLYVTKGIGTSILPIRFNAPPEIAIITIR